MNRANQTIEEQANLLRKYSSPQGENEMGGLFENPNSANKLNSLIQNPLTPEVMERGFTLMIKGMLRRGESFWVANKMVDHMATLPEATTLPTDLIAPAGFVLLEKPIIFDHVTISTGSPKINAFAWDCIRSSERGGGITCAGFAYAPDGPRVIKDQVGKLCVTVLDNMPLLGPDLQLMEYDNGLAQVVATFLHLLTQEVTGGWHWMLDKGTSRRAKRAGMDTNQVTYITMRKSVKREMVDLGLPTKTIMYTHQWKVREHWHNYWVGSGDDRRLEPRLVEEYDKGPEDKPFIDKDRIYKVTR